MQNANIHPCRYNKLLVLWRKNFYKHCIKDGPGVLRAPVSPAFWFGSSRPVEPVGFIHTQKLKIFFLEHSNSFDMRWPGLPLPVETGTIY